MQKRSTFLTGFFILFSFIFAFAQNLNVTTIANLNASGGVTFGPDGNVYVSDFGPSLSQSSSNTRVYKLEYGSWNTAVFAFGFSGASGACFDSQGNFYQSNPSGGRVSKVSTNGSLDLNWALGFNVPIGIVPDEQDNLYVCNCGSNRISKISPQGSVSLFALSNLFNCPNGLTRDPEGNLYACNFSDGRILKINSGGVVSLFASLPGASGVGNGHLTYSNGFLFVATIGGGEIYKLSLDGSSEKIAGVFPGSTNNDGPALQATFTKPNGIAASRTGDTLFVNCSVPSWQTSTSALHPGLVRMITGLCSLSDVNCPLLTSVESEKAVLNQLVNMDAIFPNPAGEKSWLSFELKASSEISLSLFDSRLREVRVLSDQLETAGKHTIELPMAELANGVYFIVLKGESFQSIRKVLKH